MLSLALPMLLAAASSPHATLILVGGKVWAGKGLPLGTAVAVAGETIAAVGSDEEVRRLAEPGTRVVDLKGRLVVPGFNDAHVHFLSGGFGLLSVDLRDAKDESEMARRVGAYAKTLPEGEWILEGAWDHEAWPEKRLPTKASIDRLTPRNPVLVDRLDGHMALANSLALKLAKIDRSTPDPPGGTIVRGPDGEPTGVLKDNALDLVTASIPEPSHERNLTAARAALKEAARLGVTSVQDNSGADAIRTYLELLGRRELTVRMNVWRNASSLADLVRAGITTGLGDDWVRVGAIKILADGSLGAGTAAFFAPFADDPKTKGLLLYPEAELERMVFAADAGGFQLAVHAIGDRANALVLDIAQKLDKARGKRDRRLRIEHAQHVRVSDLDRFSALGVVASIQPSHAIDDMRFAEKRLGKERIPEAYPLASFLSKGIPVAFGTDWFVEPLDPRLGLYAAVTREATGGGPKGGFRPEEKVPLETALDLYTRGSAFAELAEARKGTLQPGKLADLVIFGRDLFELGRKDPKGILAAPIEMTVVGGRVVFEATK